MNTLKAQIQNMGFPIVKLTHNDAGCLTISALSESRGFFLLSSPHWWMLSIGSYSRVLVREGQWQGDRCEDAIVQVVQHHWHEWLDQQRLRYRLRRVCATSGGHKKAIFARNFVRQWKAIAKGGLV